MKYTVVNKDTGAPVIQQTYDTEDDAQARCDALIAKTAGAYQYVVASVDDSEELAEATNNEQETKPPPRPPSRSGPRNK